MINKSQAYREAITAERRRTGILAVVDIVGPDIVYGKAVSSGESTYSRSEQLHDKVFTLGTPYPTLERNRWILDGAHNDEPPPDNQVGFESKGLFDENGEGREFVEQPFSEVRILQACSIYFPDAVYDGYPVDFTVEVRSGGTAYYTKTFTGNTENSVSLEGFTVHSPDAIRVTATRWSLPSRRMRVPEIVPGIYEEWTENNISALSVVHQGNFGLLSLPYGTAVIAMDNHDRRFEPRSKNGLFQSLEERQGIDLYIGVCTENGTDDNTRVGLFYQHNGGWRTGDNNLTMTWNLVDIIGLLQGRDFAVPETLPETLIGWIALLVSQLGVNFESRYTVDPDYADLPCTVLSPDAVAGKKCGQILLWVCQATGTWPRADAETGKLAVEPFWKQGNILSLANITRYPGMKANNDLARLDFILSDGTTLSIPGTSLASPDTKSVQNPFLHTVEQARQAAKLILSAYGGNQIETIGRGDPSSEIGDVVTVQLDESSATTGRLMYQDFRFQNRVLQGCQSRLLQAAGWTMYETRVLLTESGTWTAPAGVRELFLAVGQGGQAGFDGTDASYSKSGEAGADGSGGQIWYGTVPINPGASFTYSTGAGGTANGAEGEHSTFGGFSSVNGSVFPNGYTDIQGGDSFGRSGVQAPAPGTSDGGMGGAGGYKGSRHTEEYTYYRYYYTDESGNTREINKAEYDKLYSEGYAARLSRQSYSGSRTVTDAAATKGGKGAPGASGFVLIYYNTEG